MARYLVIKNNYVINVVAWDGQTPWEYPFPHDSVILDPTDGEDGGYVGIGDWYEQAENIFYRPVAVKPPDIPQELQ